MFQMKNVIKSVVLVIACLVVTGSKSIAQSKLGHINASLLITMMPEAKDADKKIQDFYTALQDQMKTMQTEFQTKYADFQKTEKTLSDASKTVKGKELQDLQDRIQGFQQNAQQQATSKQQKLMQPVISKATAAIEAVAKENKISYVFDTSKGEFLVVPDSEDILPLVKKKLGITAPTPVAGATANAK